MRRIPELDAMRGLAAVAIVVYHLWFPEQGFMGTAVDLFFVMSGYLITTIILKQRDRPNFLVTFYARRSLRIWPIYYLSLFAFIAINPALPKPYHLDALPYFLTYTQNLPQYWGATNPPFAHGFYHTWSLAVEEQYYLFWPLALVLLGRRSLLPLATALIALSVGSRMAGFSKWILLTRLDGLALGGMMASMFVAAETGRLSARAVGRILVGSGLGSVIFLATGNAAVRALGSRVPALADPAVALSLRMLATNVMYFSLIGMVIVHSGHRRLGWLRDARLAELGQMSYGIYLYHYILFDIVQDYADRFGVTGRIPIDAVKMVASFGVAALSWRLIERPLLSLKGRFDYGRQARPLATPRADGPRLETLGTGAR